MMRVPLLAVAAFWAGVIWIATDNDWWSLAVIALLVATIWEGYLEYNEPDDGYNTTVYGPRAIYGPADDFDHWETELRATHPNDGWSGS